MPPKPTVTTDDILNAAICLIREYGSESINARSIAGVLNCSTKPLFRVYDNMEKLKEDVYGKALEFYYSFLKSNETDETDENDIFLIVGKRYIQFANNEKELFRYIFLSKNMQFGSLDELANIPDMQNLIQYLAVSTGLRENKAKDLFLALWLFVHGIAAMVATNPCTLDDNEIEQLLIRAFTAQYQYLKSEDSQQWNEQQQMD